MSEPLVKFYTFIPELIEIMPIKKAKINIFEWHKKMVDYYHIHKDEPLQTVKCPGIMGICNIGWIHYAYQNFAIKTNGDGESFECYFEIEQSKLKYGNIMHDYINYHNRSQLFDFNEFKKDTLKTIIKIQSPWMVEIPKGYLLLSMPIPYNDDNHFTAAHGILKDINFLNVQLFWHSLNDFVVIKKGTPLCQYILIKDDLVDSELNVVNEELINSFFKKRKK